SKQMRHATCKYNDQGLSDKQLTILAISTNNDYRLSQYDLDTTVQLSSQSINLSYSNRAANSSKLLGSLLQQSLGVVSDRLQLLSVRGIVSIADAHDERSDRNDEILQSHEASECDEDGARRAHSQRLPMELLTTTSNLQSASSHEDEIGRGQFGIKLCPTLLLDSCRIQLHITLTHLQ
ncbi:hypothetical protein PFISCL1PPCAC_4969, partial [Pristionchus fissidentatus]